jgi:dihydrodipicolinate synthase
MREDMKRTIQGLGTALVTPFTAQGKVDIPALQRLLDRQIAAKVDFLVVLGTTGEPATMTPREQQMVRKTIVEHIAGRIPLVLGLGGNCTQEVVERIGLMKDELKRNYAAILSVCPYYNKPGQEGLYRHFAKIAEASPVPVILYNVPGRTGVNMLPETVLRLAADYPHQIIGVKEASGNQEQIQTIIRGVRGSSFVVLSGDDGLTAPLMLSGAQGLISVLSNALPEATMRLVHQPSLEQQAALDELIRALFAEGNPVGIKALLSIQDGTSDHVRLPLVAATEGLKTNLRKLLEAYENSDFR